MRKPSCVGSRLGNQNSFESEPNDRMKLVARPRHRRLMPNVYCCAFCEKTFRSPQSLGGHQNSHRMERFEQVRDHFARWRMHPSDAYEPKPTTPPNLCRAFERGYAPRFEPELHLGLGHSFGSGFERVLAPESTYVGKPGHGTGSWFSPRYEAGYGFRPGIENRVEQGDGLLLGLGGNRPVNCYAVERRMGLLDEQNEMEEPLAAFDDMSEITETCSELKECDSYVNLDDGVEVNSEKVDLDLSL